MDDAIDNTPVIFNFATSAGTIVPTFPAAGFAMLVCDGASANAGPDAKFNAPHPLSAAKPAQTKLTAAIAALRLNLG